MLAIFENIRLFVQRVENYSIRTKWVFVSPLVATAPGAVLEKISIWSKQAKKGTAGSFFFFCQTYHLEENLDGGDLVKLASTFNCLSGSAFPLQIMAMPVTQPRWWWGFKFLFVLFRFSGRESRPTNWNATTDVFSTTSYRLMSRSSTWPQGLLIRSVGRVFSLNLSLYTLLRSSSLIFLRPTLSPSLYSLLLDLYLFLFIQTFNWVRNKQIVRKLHLIFLQMFGIQADDKVYDFVSTLPWWQPFRAKAAKKTW